MKNFLLATVALAAFGLATQASAADLAARPYTKAPVAAPGVNWSGFYAGVMGGYGWANTRASVSALGVSISDTKTLSGWTVGGGAEYMFAPNWSAKAEYMYADYGSETFFATGGAPGVDIGGTVHSVKAGINYHFN